MGLQNLITQPAEESTPAICSFRFSSGNTSLCQALGLALRTQTRTSRAASPSGASFTTCCSQCFVCCNLFNPCKSTDDIYPHCTDKETEIRGSLSNSLKVTGLVSGRATLLAHFLHWTVSAPRSGLRVAQLGIGPQHKAAFREDTSKCMSLRARRAHRLISEPNSYIAQQNHRIPESRRRFSKK